LVEHNREFGVSTAGVELDVEASVIRGTQANAGAFGTGVNVHEGRFLLRTSLVEQNRYQGVFVEGAEAVIEASVVRDTDVDEQGSFGRGIAAQAHPMTGAPSTVTLRTSLVERSHDLGCYVGGASVTIESTVIRDTEPDALGLYGRGVSVQAHENGTRSTLALRTSVVERNREVGVFAAGDATVDASVVRDTQLGANGIYGRGINAQPDQTGTLSTLLVRTSLVDRNHNTGVFGAGDITVEESVVRDTQPDAQGKFGRGVSVQVDPVTSAPSTLRLRSTLIELNHEAGVSVLASVATIDTCLVRDTLPSPGWGGADGIMVTSVPGPGSVTVTGTRIHQSALAALAVFGAHAAIGQSALTCQAFDIDSEVFEGNAVQLEDLGGNLCGCPDPIATCRAVSAGLEPPPPLEPVGN
ncbi:MAG TPA: hypothetical protein VFB62_12360, partial [Polyangiaceae bacterium]|nr:hypothetical protein [Polyangiaceae bacterium]